ncbi:MAG: pre-peptidase C-terminal domain-containing protein [Magnetococcales bacterium]|nr:pre-peptidase C-terminal domain-containing protein [Magnetococcales bacterium]
MTTGQLQSNTLSLSDVPGGQQPDAAGPGTGGNSANVVAKSKITATAAIFADYLNTGYWTAGGDATGRRWGTAGSGTPTVTWAVEGDWSSDHINAKRTALRTWSDVCNIQFEMATNASVAQMKFRRNAEPPYAWSGSTVSDGVITSNFIEYNTTAYDFTKLATLGSYENMCAIHELGHSIGLGHPGRYNGSGATYKGDAIFTNDTRQYSLMSYWNAGDDAEGANKTFHGSNFARTPLLFDIVAIQAVYGANKTTRSGDTVYGFGATAGIAEEFNFSDMTQRVVCIWDGGGIDTLNLSGYSQDEVINLNQGSFSSACALDTGYYYTRSSDGAQVHVNNNISIAYGCDIENAVAGKGNDTIIGNGLDNLLTGGLGNDTINGGAGNDAVVFSGSSSQYTIVRLEDGSVTVTDTTADRDGVDRITAVEQLRFTDKTVVTTTTVEVTDDYAGTTSTTGKVTVDAPTTGNIEVAADADWFGVTLTGGKNYFFSLEGSATSQGTLANPFLQLLGANGAQIVSDDDNGTGLNAQIQYLVSQDGNYLVSAKGVATGTGTYRLSVLADDYLATTSTAGSLTVGGSATGNIDAAADSWGDADYFAVSLTADVAYTFDLEGFATATQGKLSDPFLDLRDGNGAVVATNVTTQADISSSNSNARVFYTPTSSGTYYLAAWGYTPSSKAFNVGGYRLSAVADDYAATISTKGQLTVGGSVSGNIETSADVDWFAVSLQANTTYNFSLEGVATSKGTLTDPYVQLVDSSGTVITYNADVSSSNNNAAISYTPTIAGTYYLAAWGYTVANQTRSTGSYSLSATATTTTSTDDYADNSSTTGVLSTSNPATGQIETAADADWFAVSLTSGVNYFFSLEGSATSQGTLASPSMQLLNAGGSSVATGVGTSARIAYLADSSSYFVEAKGVGDGTGSYRLSVVADDYLASTSTTGKLTVGDSVTGNIDAAADSWGDADYFAITLAAGVAYTFDLEGSATAKGSLSDPYLQLMDSTGATTVSTGADVVSGSNNNDRISYTPTVDGTYYLAAWGYTAASKAFHAGSYRLSAAVKDDYAADMASTGRLAVGGSITGNVELAKDEDWFAVTLTAGVTYNFDLEGAATAQGTLADPFLRLLDASGAEISKNDDRDRNVNRNAGISFTPTTDGTYFLAARDYDARTGSYRLSAAVATRTPTDDYTGDANTAGRFSPQQYRKNGDINTVDDADWFAINLTAGVTYTFDLEGAATSQGTLADPYLRLLDQNGAVAAFNDDNGMGANARVVYTPTSSGLYYLAATGTGKVTGSYRLAVTTTQTDDYAGDKTTTGRLSMGGSTTGITETGEDTDWFAITLAAGKTYQFDLEGRPASQGQAKWLPGLLLRDSDGKQIERYDGNMPFYINQHQGNASWIWSIVYTAPTDGTYYLTTGSIDGGTGRYNLSASSKRDTTQVDDYAADSSTVGRLSVGQPATGNIGIVTDEDWFVVPLMAGVDYVFDLEGASTQQGTLADPSLRLLDPSGGAVIISNEDGGTGLNARISYKPTISGNFFLSARGHGTGSYRLAATVKDDQAGGTGSVTVGRPITANIETPGDSDRFVVTLNAGVSYTFDLAGKPTAHGTLTKPVLQLLDPSGAIVAMDDARSSSPSSRIVYTAVSNGNYVLLVQSAGNRSSVAAPGSAEQKTGGYNLSATLTPNDDRSSNSGTTGRLTIGGAALSGNIEKPGDEDWFAVTLAANTDYRFDVSLSDYEGRLHFAVKDSSGNKVSAGDVRTGYDDPVATIQYKAQSAGTYYLSVQGDETGGYWLSAEQSSVARPDDYPDSAKGQLEVGKSVTGKIEALSDEDWFAIKLTAGKAYLFNLDAATPAAGSLADPFLQLMDRDGTTVLIANDDVATSPNAQIIYTPDKSGTYFLAAMGAGTGQYRLSAAVDATRIDDYVSDVTTTGRLAVGSPVKGNLETPQDSDWFTMTLTAGMTYTFDAEGESTGQGTLSDPHLELMGADDEVVAEDDDGSTGTNARIVFTPSEDGDYALAVSGSGFVGASGSYRLSATMATAGSHDDDYDDDPGSTGQLAVGESVTGNIETMEDEDWFTVTLVDGETYAFDLEGSATSQGNLADPYLVLLDEDGEELAYNADVSDTNGNARILYTATSSGLCYLVALGFTDSEDGEYNTGSYRLSMAKAEPIDDDYAGDAGTTGQLVEGVDAVLGHIETTADADWFAVTLVEGVSYGFEVSPDDYEGWLELSLMNGTGKEVSTAHTWASDPGATLVYTAASSGTYYLSVHGDETGSYLVSMVNRTHQTDDYADDATSTDQLSLDQVVNGKLESDGDEDWLAINLTAGMSYVFDLEGESTGQGSLEDPYLQLLDADGEEIDADDDGGTDLNPQLTYTATEDGTYFIAASGYGTGSYRLSASLAVEDDYLSNSNTTGRALVNGSVSGSLEKAGDEDWFTVTLTANKTYRFDLESAAAAQLDPYLQITRGNDEVVAASDDGGTGANARFFYTPTADGTYTVSAKGYGTGGYKLSVKQVTSVPTGLALLAADDTGVAGDNITSKSKALTVTGTASPGGKITLFEGGKPVGSMATADNNGKWKATIASLTAGSHSLTARQLAGGESSGDSEPLVISVDTSVPAAPAALKINGNGAASQTLTSGSHLQVTGTGIHGAAVVVFGDVNNNGKLDAGEPSANTVVDGQEWSVDFSLSGGTHAVKAIQTNLAGSASKVSAAVNIVVATPGGLKLDTADDTGISKSDAITSKTSGLTLTGTAPGGLKVLIYDYDGPIATTTVSKGAWKVDLPNLEAGEHSITATQINSAGGVESEPSTPFTIVIDDEKPTAPTVDALAGNGITKKTSGLVITGSGEAKASVTLLEGGKSLGTGLVGADGRWSVTLAKVGNGSHSITASQADLAGNASPASAALAISVDAVAPAAPSSLKFNSTDSTVTGKGEKGATVTVFNDANKNGTVDSGESLGQVMVEAATGSWSVGVSLNSGSYPNIKAIQSDLAGNVSKASAALSVKKTANLARMLQDYGSQVMADSGVASGMRVNLPSDQWAALVG